MLATASRDGTLRLWDVKTGGELAALGGSDGLLMSCDISRDGQLVAVTGPVVPLEVEAEMLLVPLQGIAGDLPGDPELPGALSGDLGDTVAAAEIATVSKSAARTTRSRSGQAASWQPK